MNPKRPHPPQDEGELLLSRFLDGELDAGEHADFQEWLRQAPSHVERFVKHTIDHHRTAELLRVDRLASMVDIDHDPEVYDGEVMSGLVEEALAQRRKHELEAEAERKLAEQQARIAHDNRYLLRRSQPPPREMVLPKPVLWLGLAALVGLAVWFGWPSNEPPTPRTAQQGGTDVPAVNSPVSNVAVIRNSVDARWAPGVNGGTQHLQAGNEITLRSGLVEVVFGNGTTVILEGPVTFEPTGPDGMRLVAGRLCAASPDGVTGFRVDLPDMVVTNHGADFGVVTGAATDSQVVAMSGEITVDTRDALGSAGGAVTRLSSGSGAVVHAGGLEVVRGDTLAFIDAGEFEARSLGAQGDAYAQWLALGYELRRDRDVVLHYVFDQEDVERDALTNRAPGARDDVVGRLGNGAEIAAPRWTAGRFEQTRALRFGDAGGGRTYGVVVPDHPAIDLEGEMTFVLWVRGQTRTRFHGTLLSKRDVPPRRMNYQVALMSSWLSGGSELQFGVGEDDAALRGFSYSVASGRIDAGGWNQIAVTTDGQTIRYYINGQRVHAARQALATLTNNADLLIGTSAQGGGQPYFNEPIAFLGDISEVLIVKRAYSDTEIQDLYRESGGGR